MNTNDPFDSSDKVTHNGILHFPNPLCCVCCTREDKHAMYRRIDKQTQPKESERAIIRSGVYEIKAHLAILTFLSLTLPLSLFLFIFHPLFYLQISPCFMNSSCSFKIFCIMTMCAACTESMGPVMVNLRL